MPLGIGSILAGTQWGHDMAGQIARTIVADLVDLLVRSQKTVNF
jgi:hypothetical protein